MKTRTYSNVMTFDERVAYEILEALLTIHSKVTIFYEEGPISEFIINTVYNPKFGLGHRSRDAFLDLIAAIVEDNKDDHS